MIKTILLVDDEPFIREIVSDIIHPLGHQIIQAENGKEACDILSRSNIDLLMSDLQMPGLDGFKLIAHCRTLKEKCPVIFIFSGNADDNEDELIKAGADRVFGKPFNFELILKSINDYLS